MTEARFAEKTTPYLLELSERSEAVRKMYIFDPEHEDIPADIERDLLSEKANTPVFGGVRKFNGRLLVLLSYTCGANCRYCERQDRVGVGLDRLGRLTAPQIDKIVDYIKLNPELNDIIASGGDPLINPNGLEYLFESLRDVEHVKILRIHTRFPVQSPGQINLDLMRRLSTIRPTMYLSLHISHPDEITPQVEELIHEFRKMGYIMICQSVFLKGVNDDVDVLERMYLKLFQLGVRPYYLYHCQRIPTTARFEIELRDEIEIISQLRERIDGLAFPQHVIDMPAARGKVLVPTNHWDCNIDQVRDFDGLTLSTDTWKPLAT